MLKTIPIDNYVIGQLFTCAIVEMVGCSRLMVTVRLKQYVDGSLLEV